MSWMVSSRLLSDAEGKPRSMQSLLQTEPLWCVSRPSGFFGPAQDELRDMGANLDNICSCNRLNSLIEVVEAGGGIAQLPEMMVAEQVRAGTLVLVDPALTPLTLEFTIAIHRNQGQSVVHQVAEALARLGKAATGHA
jgi:DNA-binding transcriptional LysR family regulator